MAKADKSLTQEKLLLKLPLEATERMRNSMKAAKKCSNLTPTQLSSSHFQHLAFGKGWASVNFWQKTQFTQRDLQTARHTPEEQKHPNFCQIISVHFFLICQGTPLSLP